MSIRKQTIPAIRFKGYTDEWKQRKLEEDVSVVGGATPFKSNPEYWNGPIVWLSSQEIKEKYVSKGTYTITKKAVDDNTTKVVKAGTPLIVSRSGILARLFPISIPTTDVAINQDIKALVFDTNAINTNFFVAQLQKKEAFILKSVVKTGTTVQSINMPDFYKLLLAFPLKNEQDKIGRLFHQLDATIALHQRQFDNFKDLKKTILEKIFNQELRFKDENGNEFPNWIERQLGELGEFKNGLNKDKSDFGFGFPFVNLQDVFENKSSEISNLGLINSTDKDRSEFSLLKDDVLFIRSSVKISGVGLVNVISRDLPDTTYSGFIIRFRHNNEYILSDFLKFYSNTIFFRGELLKKATTSANTNINQDSLSMLIVKIPCIVEQKKIIDFLSNLVLKLTESEKKVELMKQQKKALLQLMFV